MADRRAWRRLLTEAPERLAEGTRKVIRATDPPTEDLPLPVSPDGIELPTARAVIDLAMRLGVALLATGAGAADVTDTVLRLTRAYGLRSVHVDVTYTSVGVSYHRGPDADPITVLRVVPSRFNDFTRLQNLFTLVRSLVDRPAPITEARAQFDAIIDQPHPYRRSVVNLANAALAGAVAVLLGGGVLVTALTVLGAFVISRVQSGLARYAVPPFFVQAAAAAIPTAISSLTILAGRLGLSYARTASPSLVVASTIVLLLSGLAVVGAANDAIEGYYLTAAGRTFEILVLTFGIVIGVPLVLSVSNGFGLYVPVSSQPSLDPYLGVQLACSAVISAAFALSTYAGTRSLVAAAVLGLLGWLGYSLLTAADFGQASASALAAGAIGLVARLLRVRWGVSTLAVTTAAIVPLMPGRAVYQGLTQLTSRSPDVSGGLSTLAGAAGVGLGLAAGVALGVYVGNALVAWRTGGSMRKPPMPS